MRAIIGHPFPDRLKPAPIPHYNDIKQRLTPKSEPNFKQLTATQSSENCREDLRDPQVDLNEVWSRSKFINQCLPCKSLK